MKAEATAAMLSDDMLKLDELEPCLDGIDTLLVLARDAAPTAELMRALEPLQTVQLSSDLDLAVLAAVAAAIPYGEPAAKKSRAE